MTRWLASVQSVTEVKCLGETLPDILDLKNPAQGALGALSTETVAEIVATVAGKCQTSATIGDGLIEPEKIEQAVTEMAQTGVDFIKVGLFPHRQLDTTLSRLRGFLTALKVPVIAVMFADNMPTQTLLPVLHRFGFQGVMIDTAIKDGRNLLAHWHHQQVQDFVYTTQSEGLMCGLAGALKQEDIPILKSYNADYLGFRSALCHNRERTTQIDAALARQIKGLIYNEVKLENAM